MAQMWNVPASDLTTGSGVMTHAASRSTATYASLASRVASMTAPSAARLSVARWLRGSNERWPQKTYLSVAGLGDRDRLLAPRDEPFAVEVRADLLDSEARGAGCGDRNAIGGADVSGQHQAVQPASFARGEAIRSAGKCNFNPAFGAVDP